MKLPPLVPVSEVRALLESILVRPETICLPLDEAAGKILAKPIAADRDGPPYDRVMMDGYALRATDSKLGGFELGGTSVAGSAQAKLRHEPGAAVEVMTGAILPVGANAVVPYEWTVREGSRIKLLEEFTVERISSSIFKDRITRTEAFCPKKDLQSARWKRPLRRPADT